MEEPHVSIEIYWANSLDRVFDIEMITSFEEDGGVVDEDTIQDGVDAHLVPDDLWPDFVHQVEIDWVLHVFRTELVCVASLILNIVLEDLDHHFESASVFTSIETNAELLLLSRVSILLRFLLHILIVKDVIEYFLQKTE